MPVKIKREEVVNEDVGNNNFPTDRVSDDECSRLRSENEHLRILLTFHKKENGEQHSKIVELTEKIDNLERQLILMKNTNEENTNIISEKNKYLSTIYDSMNNLETKSEPVFDGSKVSQDAQIEDDMKSVPKDSENNEACRVKHRNSVSQVDKTRLVNAYENGENYFLLGNQLGIHPTTIRNIIYKYRKTGKISMGKVGGYKKAIIDDVSGDKLLDFLENNSDATLTEMKIFLRENVKIECSVSTITRYLATKFFATKNVKGVVDQPNSDYIKEWRSNYVQRCLNEIWRSKRSIYIEEISFNQCIRKMTERLPRGPGFSSITPVNFERNMLLIIGMSRTGPMHFKVVSGKANREVYQEFVSELISQLPVTEYRLIHDNIPTLTDVVIPNHIEIIQLPPQSTFLNPFDPVFCKLKKIIRSDLSKVPGIIEMNQSQRLDVLKNLVSAQISSGAYSDLGQYYRNIEKYFGDSILKNDIYVI